jgi:hypothetical protein
VYLHGYFTGRLTLLVKTEVSCYTFIIQRHVLIVLVNIPLNFTLIRTFKKLSEKRVTQNFNTIVYMPFLIRRH